MTYVVDPILSEIRGPVLDELRSGRAMRYGGSLRIPKGYEGAGRFVAHLRDFAPSAAEQSSTAVSQALGSVLQMTNVAAAASVLNLGVSAVGFAVMAHKLNRIQSSVDRVLASQEALGEQVSTGFASVEAHLVELRFLAMENRELVGEAIRGVKELKKDFFDSYVARVEADAHSIARAAVPTEAALEHARRSLDEGRRWLASGLGRTARDPEPQALLEGFVRFRVWCVASTLEVDVLRRQGARSEAAQLARQTAEHSRELAGAWASRLMPPGDHGGVLRLSHSRFAKVPEEVKLRLYELQEGTRAPSNLHERSVAAAKSVAMLSPAAPADWYVRQEALAGMLDFLEETTERLESNAEQMEYCDRLRLGYERWEALSAPAGIDGQIALIKVAA